MSAPYQTIDTPTEMGSPICTPSSSSQRSRSRFISTPYANDAYARPPLLPCPPYPWGDAIESGVPTTMFSRQPYTVSSLHLPSFDYWVPPAFPAPPAPPASINQSAFPSLTDRPASPARPAFHRTLPQPSLSSSRRKSPVRPANVSPDPYCHRSGAAIPLDQPDTIRPTQRVTLYTEGLNHSRRQWTLRLSQFCRYAQFDEDDIGSMTFSEWPIYCYADEFDHIFNYIAKGDYPIFYTEYGGFDVPKYMKVRRCAQHYGVKGLVDWIDAERYRKVVVKVYDYVDLASTREVPADTTLTFLSEEQDNVTISCRIIWKTELMREDRPAEEAHASRGDASSATGWECSENCIDALVYE